MQQQFQALQQHYKFSDATLISLYEGMLLPRMIEEKMLSLLRQGRVSKWFSGIGQEAISIGCTHALMQDELIFPMHRNLGVFTSRDIPLHRLFAQWQGKGEGFTKGRDRSFHFGTLDYGVVGMISHLGPQLSLAAGVALGYKLRQQGKVSLAFTGEGGTSQGEFHEALNTAAVWKLPVIFVIENNGYGLSTTTDEQYACTTLADRGVGYGMESHILEGNNILEMYGKVQELAQSIRENPRPVLLECMTFRMRGHEEASGVKYVPQEKFDEWGPKDPVANFEAYLLDQDILTSSDVEARRVAFKQKIESEIAIADGYPKISSTSAQELQDVYAPTMESGEDVDIDQGDREIRFIDAVTEGLDTAMQLHPELVLMGQDIADYGGVFKVTEGFVDRYGKDRVRNTPLCESAIIGIGIGMSLVGIPSMIEMQFADFVSCGFNQIVNNAAKLHYRWGHAPNLVIRMPTGGTVGAGPFHSQSNEAWFAHVPGLKIVYPSNPQDAKGLLVSAFEDPNPVLYFEHKALYRNLTAPVPVESYTTPIGKASMVARGAQATIITYGLGVRWALALQKAQGLDIDILDLRSLVPLDYEAIATTVKHTGRVLILHEDTMFGGLGAELSAWITEHLFEYLDAPIMRVAGLDTPIPFVPDLEKVFMANSRLEEALDRLISY